MKKRFNISAIFMVLLMLLSGCEDKPTLTQQEEILFPGDFIVSGDNIVISEETVSDVVLTANWSEVIFSVDAPVTYAVQLALNEDWSTSYSMSVGSDVYFASLTGEELNIIALEKLGVEANIESNIGIRVEAYLNQRVYSLVEKIKLTPHYFEEPYTVYPSIYIAGDYQGWNIDGCDSISSVEDNGVYEGYIYIPAGGTNEFKLYAQPDWSATSYGAAGGDTLVVANYAGANFMAPSEGHYLLAIDLNRMIFILKKIDSWGIIGEATSGGWDTDTDLVYDDDAHIWTVTADLKASGFYKFRANDAWELDLGLSEDGCFSYANHPWLTYVERPNLTVENDGNYTITLDLHVPGNYRCKVKEN